MRPSGGSAVALTVALVLALPALAAAVGPADASRPGTPTASLPGVTPTLPPHPLPDCDEEEERKDEEAKCRTDDEDRCSVDECASDKKGEKDGPAEDPQKEESGDPDPDGERTSAGDSSRPAGEDTADDEGTDRSNSGPGSQAGTPGGKRMVATEIDEEIAVDGSLSEEAWTRADVVSDFLQREPVEGATPSERTEAMILYNDEFLYVGFRLYDSEPERITATDQRRDSRMRTDDTIAVLFDTFHDHQNGFLFRVNPLGTKYDAQLRNEEQVNSQWDEDWSAAARITDEGWQAELAIPWKNIRFAGGTKVWGVDFRREIRRKNEDVYWSNYTQDFRFNQVSQAGHLVGLQDLSLTDRFRFKPYVTAGVADRNLTAEPFTDNLTDAGVEDFKIQLHPGMVLDLTANTDFAQVEVDRARVNLTRFSLFFPEKREFFLEGKDNFAFGGAGGDFGPPLALLFFSRRIGLSQSGEPIPLNVGAKLTGSIGDLQVGALNAQTGSIEGVPSNNFSVVRLQHRLMSRSRVGMLFTNRSGGGTYNRVWGADADFTFRDHFNVRGWAARADDSGLAESPWSGSLGAGWDSDRWTFRGSVVAIDEDFDTDLGFILRRGVVKQDYTVGWKPRPQVDWLRQVWMFANFEQFSSTDGGVETREQGFFTNFRLESGDSFSVSFDDNFERLAFPFEIQEGVTIPAGDHDFQRWRLGFNTFGGRRVSTRVSASFGEFFDGDRLSLGLSPSVRIGDSIQAGASYDYDRVELPAGEFSTHVVNSRFAYAFNDRWLTDALVQYVNTLDRVLLFARLNYIYRNNDDLFVVYRQTRAFGGLFEGRTDHQLISKLTYSWEF